ncbi:MAG TPA: hypothetical protein VHB21_09060 [Minicystis sp.]|nr:hypothetical protein [Minicystis sp.]
MALAASLALAGCDAGEPHVQPIDAPNPNVVDVLAFDDAGDAVSLGPSPTRTVAANTSFRIRFDRFLLPSSVIRQAVCIQAHLGTVLTLDDCTMPVSLEASYDPVTREAIFRLQKPSEASDIIPLEAGGTYQLTVLQPTTDPASTGFRSFDGAGLEEPKSFEFKVSTAKPGPEPDPTPTGDQFCAAPAGGASADIVFTTTCGASAGCHVNRDGVGAAMDLQLSAPSGAPEQIVEAVQRTAINHVAHQTMIGEHAARVEDLPSRFGRAMPIVEPNAPGNSYLLYKLLLGVDAATGKPFVEADEAERLREAFVVGMPMPAYASTPHAGAPPAKAISAATLEQLSVWIQAGAELPTGGTCP